ncbi:DUF1353 domain-containing protein [uncultured Nitrosomonas sp.]|uniref:DUF1353 domain-containing protein n=1 Tax=uncultured Nitrosomonas sp. TaxID=156424 RepID=UPI003458984C
MIVPPTLDGKYWVLTEYLVYKHLKSKMQIVAPKGFATDLVSVPCLFWIAFSPCGQYTKAAVIHDCFYWLCHN